MPAMTLGQFTEPKLLVPSLLSDTQASAIQELATRLQRADRIADAAEFVKPVLAREESAPTLVDGVALPHARGRGAKALSLAVGLSAGGVAWPTRTASVQVVFLSAVPFAELQNYLLMLSGISRLKIGRAHV